MLVLRIEHPVPDFVAWKKAFDADPVGRAQAGVRRYRVLQPSENPRQVVIELELATAQEVEALHAKLRALWGQVQGSLVGAQQVTVYNLVDQGQY